MHLQLVLFSIATFYSLPEWKTIQKKLTGNLVLLPIQPAWDFQSRGYGCGGGYGHGPHDHGDHPHHGPAHGAWWQFHTRSPGSWTNPGTVEINWNPFSTLFLGAFSPSNITCWNRNDWSAKLFSIQGFALGNSTFNYTIGGKKSQPGVCWQIFFNSTYTSIFIRIQSGHIITSRHERTTLIHNYHG